MYFFNLRTRAWLQNLLARAPLTIRRKRNYSRSLRPRFDELESRLAPAALSVANLAAPILEASASLVGPTAPQAPLSDLQRQALNQVVKASTDQIWFEQNVGQFPAAARYGFRTSFGAMLVYDDHVQLISTQNDPARGAAGQQVVDIRFTGSNATWTILPVGASTVLGSYEQPDGTTVRPAIFNELTLRNVYAGVDLRLYSANTGTLEFDWLVARAQDYGQIRIAATGQDGIAFADDGSATLQLRFHDLALKIPESYQLIGGAKQPLRVRMIAGDAVGEIRYAVAGNLVNDQPLVIDPDIEWSTFFDLNDSTTPFDSYLFSVAGNANGVYLSGWVREQITNGSFGNYMEVNAGFSQGTALNHNYIYRLNNSGTAITAWTDTGRSNDNSTVSHEKLNSPTLDAASDLELFPDGRVLVAFNSGVLQIYAADLSAQLFSGTPVTMDTLNSVAIVDNNTFYASGRVTAAIPTAQIPAANIGPEATYQGGATLHTDGVIIRYGTAATTPTPSWATYVGGADDEYFTTVAVTPDKTKIVFATNSLVAAAGGYPALVNAVVAGSGPAGTTQLLVGVLPEQATKPAAFSVFSFLGGSGNEGTDGTTSGTSKATTQVAATNTGFYVGGNTTSDDLAGTTIALGGAANGAQTARGGGVDSFVSYIPINGSAGAGFQSTYLGGSGTDTMGGIAFDTFRQRLLVFGTTTGSFPTVNTVPASNYFVNTFAGGTFDIFIATFTPDLRTQEYGTYMGGSGNDYLGQTGDLIGQGHVYYNAATDLTYLATTTHSTNWPASSMGSKPGYDKANENGGNDTHIVFAFNINVYDYGDAPASYEGSPANPAAEAIQSTLRIGLNVDADAGPKSGPTATADNYDDGIAALPPLDASDSNYAVDVSIFNNTGLTRTLQGWIDFNGDGIFEPNEQTSVAVPSSAAQQTVTLTWSSLPGIVGGQSYLRLRFSDTTLIDDPATPIDERSIGTGGFGEIEDYALLITPVGDLQISKTDGSATYVAGSPITYTIVATNSGPSFATNAIVADTIPATISGATWTVLYSGGSSGPANGMGNINASVNLANGGTATFTVTGTVLSTATGNLVNTATITAPARFGDPDLTNNSATDTDTPNPSAELGIAKSDGQTLAVPGSPITYTITVSNAGPSFANGATVMDNLPAAITGATWAAVYAGAGSTGPVSGSGNINATVSVAVGGTATFTVTGTVAPTATGSLVNSATVTPPVGTNDPNPNNNTATDTDTLTPQGDLSITKTDGSPTYTPGAAISYTIVVTNSGPSFVTGAAVADTIPANITGATWTASYVGTGSTGPASGNGDIGAVVNLAPGGTATFILSGTVPATATGNLANTATVTAPNGFTDINPNDNSATDTDTPSVSADLGITKSDGQTSAVPGSPITYTITVSNAGPSFANGATVVDNLPATITGATWTAVYAGAGSTGPVSGSGNINATVSIAVGGTATFTVTGTVAPTATGSLVNTAMVTPPVGTNDPNPNNNTDTDTDTLTPQGDLSITKTDGSATYTPGTAISYTIVVTNSGPSFVTGAAVADTIPANISGATWTASYVGTGSTGPASGNGDISAAVNLAPGGTATFILSGTVPATATGNLANTATVTAPNGFTDINPNNNSATDTDTPNVSADLGITKSDGQTTAVPGSPITYTITVSNAGPSFANGATVVDNLPATITGATWTAVYAGAGSTGPVSGSGNINATVNVAVGGTATFTVMGTVAPTATGSLVNTATVTPPVGTNDPNPNNNTDTDTDTLTPQGDLSITKTDGSPTYTPGTAISYTIVVTNSGPSFVTGAAVADTIPANIKGATWTASYVGTGSTGPASGNGDISAAVNLAPGGTATFILSGTVPSTATGNLINTATVTAPTASPTSTRTITAPPIPIRPTPIADLGITKSDGQTTAVPGSPITYTITVSNAGPSFANGATVVDNLPATITGATWTAVYAGAGSTGPVSGSGNINATVSVAVGGTATFTVTGTVAPTATGSLVNTATVAPPVGTNEPNPNNNTDTDTDTLTPQGDLSITKTDGSPTYTPGTAISYTIVVTNSGPSFVTGAAVADTIPANISGATWTASYVGTGSTGPASGNGDISAAVDLAPGGTATFILSGTTLATATGNLVNTATVTAPNGFTDTNPNNNSATDTDSPNPIADLAVTKSGPPTANANDTLTYTIVVQNNGPSAAQSVSLTDPLPAGVTFVSQTQVNGPAFALSTPGGNVQDSIATLNPGASATFQVLLHVNNPSPPGTIITNIANVATTTFDSNSANNTSPVQTTIGGTALSGSVYVDKNTNGIKDVAEAGIGGVVVRLEDAATNVVATALTALDGSYLINGLGAGNYTLVETQPAGYGSSTPDTRALALPLGGLTNQDFGDTTGSVGGVVFFDGNNDGTQQVGEPGLVGVTVRLSGTDAAGNPVNKTTTTASDGAYVFAGLLAPNGAGYTITETQPANFLQGKDAAGSAGGTLGVQDVISAIPLNAGENAAGYTFGEQGTVLAGTVFLDLDKSGTFDIGEPGKPTVTVTLLDATGLVIASTLTNPGGAYVFSGIAPGNYRIIESPPGGFTPDTPASLNVAVPASGLLNRNFGLITPNPNSLAGNVFIDLDNDALQQPGEPGLAGITVALRDSGNNVVATTNTAADGSYIFPDLADGIYSVVETQPAGYGQGKDSAGTSGGSTAVQDVISGIIVAGGTNATGYTFGELGATLFGTVFNDANADGIFGGGESGHGAVTLTLRDSGGNVVGTTVSALDGTFAFGPVVPGSYTITEAPPAGFSTTSPTVLNVSVPPSGLAGQNFGINPSSSLAGSVYIDFNNDGIRQGGEPGISNVTVTLTGTDSLNNAVSRTTTTAADGSFTFVNLPASNLAGYTLTETQPAAYGQGKDAAGSAGGNTATQDVVSGIAIAGPVSATGYLFGESSAGPGHGLGHGVRGQQRQQPRRPTTARWRRAHPKKRRERDCGHRDVRRRRVVRVCQRAARQLHHRRNAAYRFWGQSGDPGEYHRTHSSSGRRHPRGE